MGFLGAMIALLVVVCVGIWTAIEMAAAGVYWLIVIGVWIYPILFLVTKVVMPFFAGNKVSAIFYAVGFVLAIVVVLLTTVKYGGYQGVAAVVICELVAAKYA